MSSQAYLVSRKGRHEVRYGKGVSCAIAAEAFVVVRSSPSSTQLCYVSTHLRLTLNQLAKAKWDPFPHAIVGRDLSTMGPQLVFWMQ